MKYRKIYSKLEQELDNRKISIIIGPRQVGKTTILKALHKKVNQHSKSIFLDLDILSNYEQVMSYEQFINTLKLKGYKEEVKDIFYVFLDEFQRYGGGSKILKNVYDHHPNVKIFATGSSSIKIKSEVQESLAGRKNLFTLYPLDFEEFLHFKENDEALDMYENIRFVQGKEIDVPVLTDLLGEFLIYGGYPEVVLTAAKEKKEGVFESIFDLYVKKDLVTYLNIQKVISVKRLIELLAVNNGQKIKFNNLAQLTSLKVYEVTDYLELLQNTYLIQELRPFFRNKTKELVKVPKMYFVDNGVRNYFINNFNPINKRADAGFLFEGFIFGELVKQKVKNIKFWQDKNKNEVDFILDYVHKQIPIEIKYKNNLKKGDFNGLNAFVKHYPETASVILVNLGIQEERTIDGKELILRLPFHFLQP